MINECIISNSVEDIYATQNAKHINIKGAHASLNMKSIAGMYIYVHAYICCSPWLQRTF
jgi:hypothetical protein